MRGLIGETKKRTVQYRWQYHLEQSWHRLQNGDHYHYIHVYRNGSGKPFKRFAWVTTPDGTFLRWL